MFVYYMLLLSNIIRFLIFLIESILFFEVLFVFLLKDCKKNLFDVLLSKIFVLFV